ncbi:MAG: hypothetical protein ACK4NR_05885 [Micavibrio sp.]
MMADNFENRRVLVAYTLTEEYQRAMLGRSVQETDWVQASEQDKARLETVGMMIFALQGTYTEPARIERWFSKPRAQLDGKAPSDILKGEWDPQSADVVAVRKLAQYLCGDAEHAQTCRHCNPQPVI